MPRREVNWICDVCERPTCKGGCYYTPARVIRALRRLPYERAMAGVRVDDIVVTSRVAGNPLEEGWAERADIARALDAVKAASLDGGINRLIVYLAYVGRASARREGESPGLSDSEIAVMFGMARPTVARRRRLALRQMVECLNPDYFRGAVEDDECGSG